MSLVEQMDTVTDDVAGTVDRHDTTQTFESTDPATGAVVGVFPVHDADAVRETVERARPAAEQWAALGFDGRTAAAGRLPRLPRPPDARAGRPRAPRERQAARRRDPRDHPRHRPPGLGRRRTPARRSGSRRVRAGMLAANHAAYLEYQPLGVVGVIGPWNYPVFTPMGSIAYALAAGQRRRLQAVGVHPRRRRLAGRRLAGRRPRRRRRVPGRHRLRRHRRGAVPRGRRTSSPSPARPRPARR